MPLYDKWVIGVFATVGALTIFALAVYGFSTMMEKLDD